MTMREKEILAKAEARYVVRAIKIRKENWGEPRIFKRCLSNNNSKKLENT